MADDVHLVEFDNLGGREAGNGDARGTGGESHALAMQRGEQGVWTVEAELPVGTEYVFRIRHREETFERIDPKARAATSSIGRSVMTQDSFEWTDSAFSAAPLSDWVIYELHPGTFAGSLDGLVDKLDFIVDIGVNVIELMPVAEFAGDQSWGYNPALPFAVESSLGGPDALKRFVNAAHARGIAVVLDVVYNHFGPSDLDLWRFDGWSENEGGGVYFFNDWKAKTPWGDTRPDYGRNEVRQFIVDNALMWIEEFHFDGLRLDSTVNIRNAHGETGPNGDLPEGFSLLATLTDTIRASNPSAILIAEDLQRDRRLTASTSDNGLGFHLQWSGQFVHTVRSALEAIEDGERDVEALMGAIEGTHEGANRVVYTESHDEVANGRTRVPAEIDPGDPQSMWAIRRSGLGAALMMSSVGVPMLFQGQEWGEEDWFDDARDLKWERRSSRPGVVALWRDLINLRTGADPRARGLSGDRIALHRNDTNRLMLTLWRWGLGGEAASAVTVINLSSAQEEVQIPVPVLGQWDVVFASDWSGYHESGSDVVPSSLWTAEGEAALKIVVPSYGAIILVPSCEN